MNCEQLAQDVVRLDSSYNSLCTTDVPDDTLNAPLQAYYEALDRLAATPAPTFADLAHKATALRTCAVVRDGEPAMIEGDRGLAFSLIFDIIRLRG